MLSMFKVLLQSIIKLRRRYCLFHLLLCASVSSTDISCVSQRDCNDGDEIHCGICVDDTTRAGVGKCIFPFPLLYHPDKSCSRVTDCEDNCHGHGSCQSTVAYSSAKFPLCMCDEGFYGWTCEDSASGVLASVLFRYVAYMYRHIRTPTTDLMEYMRFFCGSKAIGFGSLEIFSDDKGSFSLTTVDRLQCGHVEYIDEWHLSRFPYKPPGNLDDKEILKLGDSVLGYLSSVNITIMFKGVINYQHSFPVFVYYQVARLECVPLVTVSGCAASKENAVSVERSHSVKIVSNVVFIADGKYASTSRPRPECAKHRASYVWKIWKNRDDDSIKNIYLRYYDVNTVQFNPFELEIADYRVLLQVSSLQQEYSSQNFEYCFFNVKYEPLVAVIDGGSERMVQKQFGLVLTTTRSRDPNVPSGNQSHVRSSWSCIDTTDNNRELCYPGQLLTVSNSHFVPPESLNYGAIIVITLRVWTGYYDDCQTCGVVQPAFAFARITVAKESSVAEDDIYIQCLLNCEEKVVRIEKLYLKVRTRSGSNLGDYEWTYCKGNGQEKSTASIAQPGFPSFMLVVKPKAFSSGKSYTIVVKIKERNLLAKYSFQTLKLRYKGGCSISSDHGVRGLTTFSINCQIFETHGRSLLFEFYDKTSKEAKEGLMISGRMLGTSTDGKLRHFKVTRGHIFVYVKDDSGLYSQTTFTVKLSSWTVSKVVVDEIFKNISDSKNQQDYAKVIEYISIVTDVVPSELNKSDILEKLLRSVVDLPTSTLSDVKIISSALANVILTLNKPVQLEVKPRLMNDVVNKIQQLAELLSSTVSTSTQLNGMTSSEIIHVNTNLLTCLRAIMMCRVQNTVGLNEFHLDFETEDNLLNISNSAVKVLNFVLNVLTFLQRPGLPPLNIATEDNVYVLWVVANDEDYNLTNYLAGSGIPVSVSDDFLQDLKKPISKNSKNLVLRMATLDNIFWWRRSDVKSNLVLVSLAKYSQNETLSKIKVVSNPLDVEMKLDRSSLNTTEISGITFQYQYRKKCSLELDLAVKIHRLDPAPKSLIAVKFLFPQTNGSLKVFIYRNHRPECDMMKKAVTISEQSPNYPPVVVKQDEPSFFYIGIIPGPIHINDTVQYTFQVNTTACQHWVRGYWSSQGCRISKANTTDLKVHCMCDQFSIFAAAFPVPPQEVDPFSDIGLFLTIFDNPVVVIFVFVVLFVYLMACVWAIYKDRKDRRLRNVIILGDNFPGDRYPYLIAVYTSSRFNAGTTAHVGIKLIGSLTTSRAHILTSSERKTLRRNYDDWFLIYYSTPLGDLRSIDIWHDNAGSSPDWFCDKVVVYDLRANLDAVFVVGQWLALRLDCYPEISVSVATISQDKNMKRMFLDNCVLGLRDGHIFLSIILKHPRSAVSTLQKISVLMCCIIVAMLCSIMFYSPTVDAGSFNVGLREFYISVQTLVISFVITFLVLFAFKKSYKYTYQSHKTTTLHKMSDFEEYDALQNIQKKTTFYASYVRFVSKTLKGNPMVPVHVGKSQLFVQKRTVCVWISWVSCIAVIVICSFFVMLYGLKLGLVKSKMWLSSLLFAVGQELFIIGPLRVIFFAFLLSLAFQEMSETSTHKVYVEDALRAKSPPDEEQYAKLHTRRNHPMYTPLQHADIDDIIRQKELKDKWLTVIDLVVSLCFIIALSIVVQELWSTSYHTNRHVNNIVTQTVRSRIGSEPFSAIRNVPQLENFLRFSLLRSLYVTTWYNKDPISAVGVDYWLQDFTIKKVGVERLRQLRVTSIKCAFTFISTTRRCIPRWGRDREDTQDYSVGWEITKSHDLLAKNSPWKYTRSSLGTVYTMNRLYGRSGTLYHDGGYLMYLGHDRLATEEDVTKTISNHWQDQLTSAVFIELTLFNVNQNLFSHVTIIVEYLISGNIQLKAQVMSVESQLQLSVWNALLAVFILYYLVRSGVQINRQGLMVFLSSFPNLTQVLIIGLGVLCFVVATVHYFYSAAKYDDFIHSGQSSYFDFDSFVFYFLCLRGLLSLLFCVAVIRSVITLRGGRTLLNFFYTFTLAASGVLCLTLGILVFLLLQLYWMFLLYEYYVRSLSEVVVNFKFLLPDYYRDMRNGGLFIVKSLVVSVMLQFYFVIFTHSFRIAQRHRLEKYDQFNIITFIFERIRRKKKI